MMLNTYAEMRLFDIKRKLLKLDVVLNEPDDIDVVNVALVVFSIICDAHVNTELNRHAIVEDMLDNKLDFDYYVNDLLEQTNNTNEVLNEYIDTKLNNKRNEVKK